MPDFHAFEPATAGRTLAEVVGALESAPAVRALVALGSTAGTPTPWSDYDLLLALDGGPEFDVEFTYVDHRATDVVLVQSSLIEGLAEAAAPRPTGPSGDLARWLATGQVLFCKDPTLARQIACVGAMAERAAPMREEQFSRWVEANFLLAKFRRYLHADDPRYSDALELALHGALHEVVRDFLCFRGHAWEGEKVAWARLEADPVFAAELRAALRADTLTERFARFEALVRRACEPVGGIWPRHTTAGGWNLDSADPRASSRWEALFSRPDPGGET